MPELVDLPGLKLNLRVTDDAQDDVITALGVAARELCELMTDYILVRRQVVEVFPKFTSPLKIWKRPVVTLDEIAYTDRDEVEQVYAGAVLQELPYPALVHPANLESWPSDIWSYGGVKVTYTAGFEASDIPEVFNQAIRLLVAHWYNHREAVVVDASTNELPFAVKSLLGPYMSAGVS